MGDIIELYMSLVVLVTLRNATGLDVLITIKNG